MWVSTRVWNHSAQSCEEFCFSVLVSSSVKWMSGCIDLFFWKETPALPPCVCVCVCVCVRARVCACVYARMHSAVSDFLRPHRPLPFSAAQSCLQDCLFFAQGYANGCLSVPGILGTHRGPGCQIWSAPRQQQRMGRGWRRCTRDCLATEEMIVLKFAVF